MTEREKMNAGLLYDPTDKELAAERLNAHKLSKRYNDTFEDEEALRAEILSELLPNRGKDTFVQGPVQIDYGLYTTIGERCFLNYNFTLLDSCPVTIGDDVFFGPNCSLVTALHPLLTRERRLYFREDGSMYDTEYAAPITIQNGCWLATGVTVCGGVTIGENSVIGAGSVVTRDIPANVFAAGVPCKVIRPITEEDALFTKKEMNP